MPIDIKDILNDPQDDDFWKEFIKTADTAVTQTMNVTRVASEIYLSKTLKFTGTTIKEELEKTGDKLQKALSDHAKALNESADAANKQAKGLKWATWVLVLATFGLIIATILQATN